MGLKVYELLIPGPPKDSSKQIVDAIAYSCLNYMLLSFFVLQVEKSKLSASHPNLYFLFYFFVLFISPILIVLLWKWIRSSKIIQMSMPHPTGKPWDYVFSQKKPYWIKIVLNDGTTIGGLYSGRSFASSAPANEQIYLQETWILNDNGGFVRRKNRTAGVIVLSSDIAYIELRENTGEENNEH